MPRTRAAWAAPLAGSSAPRSESPRIAYFSMEIALHPAMPTYSGGLGMLAGDMLRAAADRELPMVAVTLLHRRGYFYQTLDDSGWQTEASVEWIVEDFVRELPHRAAVTLEGSTIQLRAWQYDVRGGVPSLSILDGGWIEGCIEGVTGWAIGGLPDPSDGDEDRSPRDAASLYDKLEGVVVPLFYRDREGFIDVMRYAIALNGSFFNAQRMVMQYVTKAYFR
jgi:glucan phosphorylase